MIDLNSIDIVCVTEEAEICFPGFTPFRGNRDYKLDCSNLT